jgi:hypothetical protein
VGVNVIDRVQLALTASVAPQLLVSAKTEGFVPVSVMLVMLRGAVPGFERATVCAVLVVPLD